MAKLSAYYGLCPLIGQENLLGISEDAEQGHVIVTLGKNIAIKYRLSDQKQIQSWRTKDKFTSPIVYDQEEKKYVSIFNQVNIRLWTNDDIEHLDKIKKYKIAKPIYTILSCNKKTFVVFKTGSILTLKDTLEQRKDLDVKDIIDINTEQITDVIHTHIDNIVYIGLIVETKSVKTCVWTTYTETSSTGYQKMELRRTNCSLSGYTCCHMSDKCIYFLTLWSDGQLYSYPVAPLFDSGQEAKYTEEFGSLYATIESISCKQFVAMVGLTNDHIGIYGADCSEEGASLIIYNTQFKISQSKQTFKMFSNTKKIWCVENVLLLCSGQNLAVVPFHINTEHLSELIGSHKIDINDTDIQQTFTVEIWDTENENDYSSLIPLKIKPNVLNCLGQGLSETAVCSYLIPFYIESLDIEAVECCIDYFKDIPEICLVKLLIYLVKSQLSVNSEITENNYLIDKVLCLPYTNNSLLPHIKEYFDLDITLQLLKYIYFQLSSEKFLHKLNYVETENKLIEWGCVILDGNYQQFLLTRDAMVHNILKKFNALVEEYIICVYELRSVEPMISQFVKRKCISGSKQNNVKYSVENIKLY